MVKIFKKEDKPEAKKQRLVLPDNESRFASLGYKKVRDVENRKTHEKLVLMEK